MAKNPDDAGFRALLGNTYFRRRPFPVGRGGVQGFADDLSQAAAGRAQAGAGADCAWQERRSCRDLNVGRAVLDSSDYGLALALAGRADQAIAVLDPAAREPGADATVRQNLALAHALRGDWAEARTIAAQDVPAGQLDARMQQWMQLASPKHASDQVAALVGVTPAASRCRPAGPARAEQGRHSPRRRLLRRPHLPISRQHRSRRSSNLS